MKWGKYFDGIRGNRLYIDDDCDSTLANLRSKARRQQMEHGLDLLIVDYLQLIDVGGRVAPENRVQEVSKISRDLKRLARELKIPIIAVSQLSRNVENRTDKRPQLSDLRESGSIEQDADTVLMLYRDDYYNEDTDQPNLTDVYIRKQRQGPTGRVELRFNRERMSHESVAK
jgi:replicative DNA helicase